MQLLALSHEVRKHLGIRTGLLRSGSSLLLQWNGNFKKIKKNHVRKCRSFPT